MPNHPQAYAEPVDKCRPLGVTNVVPSVDKSTPLGTLSALLLWITRLDGSLLARARTIMPISSRRTVPVFRNTLIQHDRSDHPVAIGLDKIIPRWYSHRILTANPARGGLRKRG